MAINDDDITTTGAGGEGPADGGSNAESHDGGADGSAGGEGTADGGSNPEGHDGGADGSAGGEGPADGGAELGGGRARRAAVGTLGLVDLPPRQDASDLHLATRRRA